MCHRAAWAAALVLVTASAHGARAEIIDEFQEAGWYGFAFSDNETGRFSYCAVERDYANGITLRFALPDDDFISVQLFRDEWRMPEGAEYESFLRVDGRRSADLTAFVATEGAVDIPLATDSETIAILRYGNRLDVSFNGRNYDFSLAGTSRALARLQDCVTTHRAYAAAPRADGGDSRPASPNLSDSPADRLAFRLEASELVANILNGAGIGGFQLIGDDEGREYFNNPDALWSTEHLIGAALVHENLGSYSIDDVAIASIIGMDGCADGRNVASQRERIGTLEVVNIAVDCIEGVETISLVSTILPRRAGGFYELRYGLTSESTGRDQLDLAMAGIREAAMTVVGNGTAAASRRKGAVN